MNSGSDDVHEQFLEKKERYPEGVLNAAYELSKEVEDMSFLNKDSESITLYRGGSAEQLEKMGYDPESGEFENGCLSRKAPPIYFTGKETDAEHQLEMKAGQGQNYIIEIEVPFDSVGDLNNTTETYVEENYRSMDLDPGTVYFLKPSSTQPETEWISTEIPEEWVQNIEEI